MSSSSIPSTEAHRIGEGGVTNISHVKLTAAATSAAGTKTASESTAATTAKVTTGRTAGETGFGFTILGWEQYQSAPLLARYAIKRDGGKYLADIDKSAHQILVAKRVDGILRLLPGRVFHNPIWRRQLEWASNKSNKIKRRQLTRIPTISRTARPSPSTQQSIKSKPKGKGESRNKKDTGRKKKKKPAANYALAPTFDIPFGSNKTSAKITSPAVNHAERSFPPPGQPRIPNPARCKT